MIVGVLKIIVRVVGARTFYLNHAVLLVALAHATSEEVRQFQIELVA
jgi:hypothetical protein